MKPADLGLLDATPIITPAMSDILACRLNQVTRHGHSASADDARGPYLILRDSMAPLGDAISMLHGPATLLTPHEQAVCRKRIIKAIAMQMAGLDTLDRALTKGDGS